MAARTARAVRISAAIMNRCGTKPDRGRRLGIFPFGVDCAPRIPSPEAGESGKAEQHSKAEEEQCTVDIARPEGQEDHAEACEARNREKTGQSFSAAQ